MAKRGNPYHVKAGSSEGGQFTSNDRGTTAGSDRPRADPKTGLARGTKSLNDTGKAADTAGTAARKAAGLKPVSSISIERALQNHGNNGLAKKIPGSDDRNYSLKLTPAGMDLMETVSRGGTAGNNEFSARAAAITMDSASTGKIYESDFVKILNEMKEKK